MTQNALEKICRGNEHHQWWKSSWIFFLRASLISTRSFQYLLQCTTDSSWFLSYVSSWTSTAVYIPSKHTWYIIYQSWYIIYQVCLPSIYQSWYIIYQLNILGQTQLDWLKIKSMYFISHGMLTWCVYECIKAKLLSFMCITEISVARGTAWVHPSLSQ